MKVILKIEENVLSFFYITDSETNENEHPHQHFFNGKKKKKKEFSTQRRL